MKPEDDERFKTKRSLWYDKDGTPMDDFQSLENKLSDNKYKRVELTNVGASIHVSTVWLVLDHNMTGSGPPLIFETMIFDDNHGDEDNLSERYSTLEQAKAGHKKWVRFMDRQGVKDDI